MATSVFVLVQIDPQLSNYTSAGFVTHCIPGAFTVQAIYNIERDVLTIAITMPGASWRPQSFTPSVNGNVKVFELVSVP